MVYVLLVGASNPTACICGINHMYSGYLSRYCLTSKRGSSQTHCKPPAGISRHPTHGNKDGLFPLTRDSGKERIGISLSKARASIQCFRRLVQLDTKCQ